jgi:hypothetical protein
MPNNTAINIQAGTVSISSSAFAFCSGLTSVTIPNSVTSIGSYAFYSCSGLTSITIPNSVTTIESGTFSDCSDLIFVTIGTSVTTIGSYAFYSCSGLISVTIPNSVTSIGERAFSNCSGLISVTIGTSVTTIGSSAFSSCSRLATVNFNARNCTSMGNSSELVFSGCLSLSTLNIGKQVQTIPDYAFYNCNYLTSITIPDSVTTIGDFAFTSPNITEMYIDATIPPQIFNNTFCNVPNTIPVHVPCGSTENYKTASFWNNFSNIIEVIPFNINVQSDNNLMGSSAITQANTCTNDTAIIAAIPNTGYYFVQWQDGNTNSPRTVTLTKDTSFTAIFAIIVPTYQVTVATNNPTMGIVSSSGSYTPNTAVTIAATPNTGYRFVQWNDGNTNNPRTITVTQDTTFTAEFEALINVIATANDPAMGSVTGNGEYVVNTVVTMAVTPNTGYHFVQWQDGNTSNPRTITVTQDTTFTATFEALIHLTTTANKPAMGIITGEGDYIKDSPVIITATPNAGYRFVGWQDGNTNNPRVITITSDTVLIAEFAVSAPGIFHVTVNANNTNMGSVTGSGDYATNSIVTINAIANAGYRFVQWQDGNRQNPRTITITSDILFTAEFAVAAQGMFHVTVNSNNTRMGSLTSSGDYAANSVVTISAIANAGYRFAGWQDGNIENPRTLTVMQDTAFMAEFAVAAQGIFHVTVNSNNIDMGNVTGSGDYAANGSVIMEAIVNAGYRFAGWQDGNTENPRSITVVQDTVFTAEFAVVAQGMFHITVNSNNTRMGRVTGSGDYAANSIVTMEAIVNTGYRFAGWQDGNTENPRTITIISDTVFRAEFSVSAQGIFHITVNSNNTNMGTVTGNGDYAANSTVTIGAITNTGYRFVQWNDGNTDNPRTIIITSDTVFTAEFSVVTQEMFHVTVNSNNTDMGTVTGSGDYAVNTTITMSAIANTGYHFVQWQDGNTDNPRTITITSDTVFTAEFSVSSPNTYQVNLFSNDQTKGSVMGGGNYTANSTVTIGAIAGAGYRFMQWNDGNTDNPRSFILTQDTIFVATFEGSVGITNRKISAISVYPNPAMDNITIVLPENVAHAVFTLYDIQNKLLIRKEVNNQDVIFVSNLAKGIYIYNVGTEKESYQGKIVKQ